MNVAVVERIKMLRARDRIGWQVKRLQKMRVTRVEIMVSEHKKIRRRFHVRLINAQAFQVRGAHVKGIVHDVTHVQHQVGCASPDDFGNLKLAERIHAAVAENHEADRAAGFQRAKGFDGGGNCPVPFRTGGPIENHAVRRQVRESDYVVRGQVGVKKSVPQRAAGSEFQFRIRRHRGLPDHLRLVAGNILDERAACEIGD